MPWSPRDAAHERAQESSRRTYASKRIRDAKRNQEPPFTVGERVTRKAVTCFLGAEYPAQGDLVVTRCEWEAGSGCLAAGWRVWARGATASVVGPSDWFAKETPEAR